MLYALALHKFILFYIISIYLYVSVPPTPRLPVQQLPLINHYIIIYIPPLPICNIMYIVYRYPNYVYVTVRILILPTYR